MVRCPYDGCEQVNVKGLGQMKEPSLSHDFLCVNDGAYHELDLSNIVGDKAIMVLMVVSIMGTVSQSIFLRKCGYSNYQMKRTIEVASGEYDIFQCWIGVDGYGKMEYRSSVGDAKILIIGWINKFKG